MRCVTAGVVLLLAAVSGCSSGDAAPAEVGPLASATASAGTGVAPTSTPSAGGSAEVPVVRDVPTVAQVESPQGASAFVTYYFTTIVNGAYASGDPAAVAALSDPACGSCANIVADVLRLTKTGRRVAGDRFKLHFAEAASPDEDNSVVVDFRFSSDTYAEVDSAGRTVRTEPAQVRQDAQVKLDRRGGSWVVVAIRTV